VNRNKNKAEKNNGLDFENNIRYYGIIVSKGLSIILAAPILKKQCDMKHCDILKSLRDDHSLAK